MPKPNHEKEEQWKQHFADWKRSGLSGMKWCKDQGLSYHTFSYWRARLRKGDQQMGGFIEVSSEAEPMGKIGMIVSVGPFQVKLEQDFDEATLERLLGVLGRLA